MTLLITETMSMSLQSGEMLLYVDLPQNGNAEPIINELKALGYEPKPQSYTWYRDGDPNQPINGTCALLYRGIPSDTEAVFLELEADWHKLSKVFGSGSLGLVMGSDGC